MKEVENIVGNAYNVKIRGVENVRKMRKIYHCDSMLEAKFYFRTAIAGSEETLVLSSLYSPTDGGLH